jgi:hypothetical protein
LYVWKKEVCLPSPEFSPSQVVNWSRCPVLWKLQNVEKWVTKEIGNKEIAALCGNVFGKGMEVYNLAVKAEGYPAIRGDADRLKKLIETCVEAARVHGDEEARKLVENGHTIANVEDADAKIELALKALTRFLPADPTPSDWVVLGAEVISKEHGWCRCDVLYQTPDLKRVVRDYKFKLKLDTARRPTTLAEYGDSSQGQHYLYAYDADVFEVCLVTMAPWYAEVVPFVKDPVRLAAWVASQKTKWGIMQRMRDGLVEPWEADVHRDQYGDCGFKDACLQYNRDPERMKLGGYIQLGRR